MPLPKFWEGTVSTIEVLDRLNFAIDYLSKHQDGPTRRIAFVRKHVLDLVGCSYFSLWRMDDEADWSLTAEDGECDAMPKMIPDWLRHNREVASKGHPSNQEVIPDRWLWSQSLVAQQNPYVFHLCHENRNIDMVESLGSVGARLILAIGPFPSLNTGNYPELNSRQERILGAMAEGKIYAQIAKELGYSESLIKQEAMHICRLLGVRSRFEAVEIFRRDRG